MPEHERYGGSAGIRSTSRDALSQPDRERGIIDSLSFITTTPEIDMATIIAGRFDTQDEATRAVAEIERAGFPRHMISSFYNNPPAMHGEFPTGGDQDISPGAKETPAGIAAGTGIGGAVGVAIGAATIPVMGPLGPALGALTGAHIGNLVGTASATKETGEPEVGGENSTPLRRAGMMVAVALGGAGTQDTAVDVLRSCGAMDIEIAEGTIENGDWSDFDPVQPLRPLPQ